MYFYCKLKKELKIGDPIREINNEIYVQFLMIQIDESFYINLFTKKRRKIIIITKRENFEKEYFFFFKKNTFLVVLLL